MTLEAGGYVAREAVDGREALAAMKDALFDLIVLDLSMPEMDGLEFLEAVRAASSRIKIIVISGFMDGVMLPAARHLGGAATLAKPFPPDSLLLAVDEALAENGPVAASN